MRNIILVAALESEYFPTRGQIAEIQFTGVGKINAARVTTQLILEKRPNLIINLGTAGCLKREDLGEVFGIKEVIERDMQAEPLAPRGTVPCSNQSPIYTSKFGTAICATGDSFVTAQDSWLIEKRVDLVDMELFAIAKVATYYGIEWKSIKFASDVADMNAADDWVDSLKSASKKINEMIGELLS